MIFEYLPCTIINYAGMVLFIIALIIFIILFLKKSKHKKYPLICILIIAVIWEFNFMFFGIRAVEYPGGRFPSWMYGGESVYYKKSKPIKDKLKTYKKLKQKRIPYSKSLDPKYLDNIYGGGGYEYYFVYNIGLKKGVYTRKTKVGVDKDVLITVTNERILLFNIVRMYRSDDLSEGYL